MSVSVREIALCYCLAYSCVAFSHKSPTVRETAREALIVSPVDMFPSAQNAMESAAVASASPLMPPLSPVHVNNFHKNLEKISQVKQTRCGF